MLKVNMVREVLWFTVSFDLPANADEPVRPEFDGFKQLLIDDQTVSINSLGQYLEHLSIEYESLTSAWPVQNEVAVDRQCIDYRFWYAGC